VVGVFAAATGSGSHLNQIMMSDFIYFSKYKEKPVLNYLIL